MYTVPRLVGAGSPGRGAVGRTEGVRLVILDSPYRLLLEPLLGYVEKLTRQGQPGELITIVVPQFVPWCCWNNLLHTQAALMLRMALLSKPGVTVTDVPYHVR